ncbi:hypothetical protein [Streptomyces sp. NPDC048425]|uniref:hypothetical protein n=1 Tax=Streptomyces sp. NPDC048425 TaxID=3365548 RepID=UPI00371877DA
MSDALPTLTGGLGYDARSAHHVVVVVVVVGTARPEPGGDELGQILPPAGLHW